MAEPSSSCLVQMRGITKAFMGKKANDAVDLDLNAGEVLALLGENGAGKSTLMNVLSGIYTPDAGEILVGGTPVRFRSPHDAIAAGIGMVHQHFMLVPSQTVWENMVLGMDLPVILPRKKIIAEIQRISSLYGLEVDPEACVWQLSIGEQQRVAILKALYRNARVLILDEPTAVLTPQEAEKLFDTIRRMTREGRGVIFISHKLDEILELSRRIAVLRRGRLVGALETARTTKEEIAELMVGSRMNLNIEKKRLAPGPVVQELSNVGVINDRGLWELRHVSLRLHEGEILGLAGVSGNGQTALCQAMAGLCPLNEGTIAVDGEDFTHREPRAFINKGIRYIPADRKGEGMVGNMDVTENSMLKRYWTPSATKGQFGLNINWKAMKEHAKNIVRQFSVDTPSIANPVRNLSGGNLQKLMLGRELSDPHRVLLAMNPTWGLDVAATRFVREQILAARDAGTAVFLVSEDLEELAALCDRLAVIYRGQITGIINDPQSASFETIGLLMAGAHDEGWGE